MTTKILSSGIRIDDNRSINCGVSISNQNNPDYRLLYDYTNRNCFFQLVMPDLILDGWDIDELLKMEKEFDYSGHNAFKLYRNDYGHTCYDVQQIDRNYTGIDGWYIGIIK